METNVVITKENPFTAKASAIRYWKTHISNNMQSPFLLSKASPLSAAESAFFAKLAAENALSSHLAAFCTAADLFCLLGSEAEAKAAGVGENHRSDANFNFYTNKQFANYGGARLGGSDQFKNYSDGVNFATGSFSRYSRGSTGHLEGFAGYAGDANVAAENFTSYGASATGGGGDFKAYMPRVNVPDLRFASYDADANGHPLTFSSYADDTNSGSQGFAGYGRNGNSAPVGFTSYGGTSNVVGSKFSGYGELANAANDSFKAYTTNANNPSNNFKSYGGGGNGGTDSFNSYRDSANAGTDNFQSYGRASSTQKTNFLNYGKSFNVGTDLFKEYGKGAVDQTVGFKIYGINSTFKDYAKKGVTFAGYTKPASTAAHSPLTDAAAVTGKAAVEEGKFFRESMLKQGKVMKMPNIQDWMPKRSFLPPTILTKLPLSELERTFNPNGNPTVSNILKNALDECTRAPSPGETKRCAASVEGVIDFAVSILGSNIQVRTTENVKGSSQNVVIGEVRGVNGGIATESVSCHQSLFPYLLYYCHSVPRVRVYEVDIHEVGTMARINRGTAICHLDTSTWSPRHGAFVALGYGPGEIEVCHWIFENDMTWTLAD